MCATLAAMGLAANNASPHPPYKVLDVKNGGTITGVVRLQGEVPKAIALDVTKDNDWCGRRKVSPRLVVGKNGAVKNAVISLDIVQGKSFEPARKFVLNQHKCEYEPHIMLLPPGSDLEIVNSDPILHNVHAYSPDAEPKTIFNIAQPVKGFRFPIRQNLLASAGSYIATCDAGHPWMSAYIVVPKHPYYAVTDAEGKFVLSDVPPGSYTITMWHEGVAVAKTETQNGKTTAYHYEAPYEVVKEVTVGPEEKTKVDFELTLRFVNLSEKRTTK